MTVFSTACASGSGGGPPPLDFAALRASGEIGGMWVGGTNVLGGYTLIEAELNVADGRITGVLLAPSENVSRLPVLDGRAADSSVWFTFRSPFGVHRASGHWDGGMVFGRIEGAGLTGDFHLVPARAPEPDVTRRRVGSYAERPGHHLLLTERAEGQLAWAETEPLDDGSMWIAGGALYAYSRDTVYTDRSVRAEPRVHEWATFRADESIEWHPEAWPARTTRRLPDPVRQEAMSFSNGVVELSGTLLLPPGAGPHPAAVLVHGSGPVERTHLPGLLRADLLLRRGIAVLVYDKRGVGGSSGNWEEAGIEELAGDAAAAVERIRAHPDVDSSRVGLVGHSQAGWVIPAAARLTPGVDFLVVLSGGGITPRDQEIFRAREEAAAAGLASDDAARLMELKWTYAETGSGWEAYVAAVRAADSRIIALVEAQPDPAPERWALVRELARYDPLPDLRAVRVPTLVIFGSADDNVDVPRAIEAWRGAVAAHLLRVETIAGAGHALIGVRDGFGSIFPAELVSALDRWLDARPWSSGPRARTRAAHVPETGSARHGSSR